MKTSIAILLLIAAISFSACKKKDVTPTETGTINGLPAITLYGTTGLSADYMLILISNSTNNKKISYGGMEYTYTGPTIGSGNAIVVSVAPYVNLKATLDTGAKTILTFTDTSSTFASTVYTSR